MDLLGLEIPLQSALEDEFRGTDGRFEFGKRNKWMPVNEVSST
jgi:hypothetical protein